MLSSTAIRIVNENSSFSVDPVRCGGVFWVFYSLSFFTAIIL